MVGECRESYMYVIICSAIIEEANITTELPTVCPLLAEHGY